MEDTSQQDGRQQESGGIGPAAAGNQPVQGEPAVYSPASLVGFPWKRIGLVALAVVLVVGLFFGIKAFLVNRVPEKKAVEITYWGLSHDQETMQVITSEYEAKTGVKVKYLKQDTQDYRERLISALAKGTGPDIFSFHNTWRVVLSSQTSTVPSTIMDQATYEARFYPVVLQDLGSESGFIGVPTTFDGLGLYVNQTIFRTEDKQPPTTWDELRRTAAKLTKKDSEGRITQAGVALGSTANVDHWQEILGLMLIQNGADPANPTGQLAQDALSFFLIFTKQDGVWDETLSSSTTAFAQGKVAMYFGPSGRSAQIKKLNPNLEFRVVPVPQLPKLTSQESDVGWASYWAEGVWTGGKHKDEAWRFLEFLTSKESLQKLYQGAVQSTLVGFPYPRPDMAEIIRDDPIVGAYVRQAPVAKSWYLASETFDGPTGINSRIASHYADALASLASGGSAEPILAKLASGVGQTLAEYSIKR